MSATLVVRQLPRAAGSRRPTRSRRATTGEPRSRSLRRRRDACESSVRVRPADAVVPDVAQELALREHALGLAREAEEQLVLLLRELDRRPPTRTSRVGCRCAPAARRRRRPSGGRARGAARHGSARRAPGSRTGAGRSRRSRAGTRGRGRPRRLCSRPSTITGARSPSARARRRRPRARGRTARARGTSSNPSCGRCRSRKPRVSGSASARSSAAAMRPDGSPGVSPGPLVVHSHDCVPIDPQPSARGTSLGGATEPCRSG